MVASACAMLALSQPRSLSVILVLSTAAGLAAELYRPAAGALVADLVEPARRVVAYGVYRFATNLGFAAGPAVAGLLAARSWDLVFVGDAATSLVFAGIAVFLLPRGSRAPRAAERRGESLRLLARDRPFLLFLVATLLVEIVYFQQYAALPLHVSDQGFSPAIFGSLLSINGLVVVLFELPLTGFTRRVPAAPVLALSMALIGVGFALTGAATSVAALAVTVVVWSLGEIVGAPVASAYVADVAPEHLRGRYQGAWGFSSALGLVIAPALGTAVYGASPAALWVGCAAAGLLSAVFVAAGTRLASDRS
jgi:MFS family permease